MINSSDFIVDFVTDLLRDIENKNTARRAVACPSLTDQYVEIPRLVASEMPIASYLGTLVIESDSGSIIKCYSYYDPSFHVVPYELPWSQKKTTIDFIRLERMDRAYFNMWQNFTLYNLDEFHRWLLSLQRTGVFRFYVSKETQ